MGTIQDFCQFHGIRIKSEMVYENPNMEGMPQGSTHYRVTLFVPYGKQLETFFSMGPALTHAPTAHEVLSCLASDACSVENALSTFEEWADDLGFDRDSKRAERIYWACKAQAEALRKFLGEAYETLLYDVEPY